MKKGALSLTILSLVLLVWPISAKGAEFATLDEQITFAVRLYKDEIYDLALEQFSQLLAKAPTTPRAKELLFYAADCQYRLKDYTGASASYQRLLKDSPQHPQKEEMLWRLADCQYQLQEYNAALLSYQQLTSDYPQSKLLAQVPQRVAALKFKKAESLYTQAEYAPAAELYQALLQEQEGIDLPWPEIRYKLGCSLFHVKNHAQAIQVYNQLLLQVPDTPHEEEILHQLGLSCYEVADYKASINILNKFLDKYPQPAAGPSRLDAVRYVLSWAYYRAGQYREALGVFNEVEARRPENPQIKQEQLFEQGYNHFHKQDYQQALKSWEELLGSQPPAYLASMTYRLMAESHFALHEDDAAIEALKALLENYPQDRLASESYFLIGRNYYQRQFYAQAHEPFQQAIALDPLGKQADDAQFMLGETYFQLKQFERAMGAYQVLIGKYPFSPLLDQAYWKAGEAAYWLKQYPAAIKNYGLLLKDFAHSSWADDAKYKTGLSYLQLGNYDYALAVWQELLKQFPESEYAARTQFQLGEVFYLQGDYQQGLDAFEKVISKYLDAQLTARAKLRMAIGHYQLEDYPLALKTLDKIISDYPQSKLAQEALYWKGWVAAQQENWQDSNQYFLKFLQQYPDSELSLAVLWKVSRNYFALRQYEQTIEKIQELLTGFPHNPFSAQADELLQQARLRHGQYRQILESSTEFVRHNPSTLANIEAYWEQGERLFERRLYAEARQLYQEVLVNFSRHPQVDRAQFMLAESWRKAGDLASALSEYKKLVDRYPQNAYLAEAYYHMASINYYNENYRQAIPLFEKVLAHPKAPPKIAAPAQYFIGLCYQQLQNLSEVSKAFQRVVTDFPDYAFPAEEKLKIGLYLQKQKQYELAIEAYRQVLRHSTHSEIKTEAQYWIGECYRLQGQYKQAAKEYLMVTYLHPEADMWAITARFKAGEAYEVLGQWEEAIKLYQKIATQNADSTQGRFAARRIEQLQELMKKEKQPTPVGDP